MKRKQLEQIATKMRFINGVSAVSSQTMHGTYYIRAVMYNKHEADTSKLRVLIQKVVKQLTKAAGIAKPKVKNFKPRIVSSDIGIIEAFSTVNDREQQVDWQIFIDALPGSYIVTLMPQEYIQLVDDEEV